MGCLPITLSEGPIYYYWHSFYLHNSSHRMWCVLMAISFTSLKIWWVIYSVCAFGSARIWIQTSGRHEFVVNGNLLFQRISLHYRFRRFLHVAGNFSSLFILSARLGRHESGFKLRVDKNWVSCCTLIVSCVVLMIISSFNASLSALQAL